MSDEQRVVIREAAAADCDALVALFDAFTKETVREDVGVVPNPDFDARRPVLRYLDGSGMAVLLAEAGGEAVGFACVEFRPGTMRSPGLLERLREVFKHRRRSLQMFYGDHGYIAYLYVAPTFRRQRIGRELVLACGEWTRNRGGKALDLNVLARNDVARKLYERIGMDELIVTYRLKL